MATKKSQLVLPSTRARAKSLRTDADYVRTSIPVPGVPLIEAMGRAMTAYAEFPVRLMRCNSPAQLWIEYLRFGQVLFRSFEGLSHSALSGDEEHLHSGKRPQRRRRSSRTQHARRKQGKSRAPAAGPQSR
jgi:hypothetical protein